MRSTLSTASLPARDRFEFWREMLSQQAMPVAARTRYTEDFTGSVRAADFGPVKVVTTENRSVDVERTSALIRRGDPEAYVIVLSHTGRQQLGQDRRVAVIGPGDMVFLHTSHPFYTTGDPQSPHQIGTVLMLEPSVLPIPAHRLSELVARPLSSSDGLVSLVSQYILGLSTGQFHLDDAGRIASITVSLVSLMLARQLDSVAGLPIETRQDALYARVRGYIVDRLGDATLTPESIAVAHHISVRNLQRIFHANDVTVATWIRELRLERCWADLLDPALATRPVRGIALRWGFPDATHFTRVFKEAYGQSPAAYRAQHASKPSN